MLSANLHETASQLNIPKLARLVEPPGDELTDREGSIVFTLGLSGITSTQILAEDSEIEKRLRRYLLAVHPILERLHEAMTGQLHQAACIR